MAIMVIVLGKEPQTKKEDAAMSKNMPPSTDTPITRGQVDRLYDRFVVGLCKSGLPSEPTQYVLENEGNELVDEFVDATRRRVESRIRATEPHILKRQPFDPAKFIGKGWTIDEQVCRRTEDNLDAGEIVRKDYLKSGEASINGEERLRRIKAAPGDVQLNGEDFLALYEEKGQLTLWWLYETKGITWLSFWGIILRHPVSRRFVLYLYRKDDGSWGWGCGWVDGGEWSARIPSAALASSN